MNKIESRHRLIRSIISERRIHTQQELQEALEANGVLVTQSTLSRDVKSLNLVKINDLYAAMEIYREAIQRLATT